MSTSKVECESCASWRNGAMKVLDELAGDGNEGSAPYLRVRQLRARLSELERVLKDAHVNLDLIFTQFKLGTDLFDALRGVEKPIADVLYEIEKHSVSSIPLGAISVDGKAQESV